MMKITLSVSFQHTRINFGWTFISVFFFWKTETVDPEISIAVIKKTERMDDEETPIYVLACTIYNSAGKPNFTTDVGAANSAVISNEELRDHNDRHTNYIDISLTDSTMVTCNVSDNRGNYSASRYIVLSGMFL